MPIWQDYTPDLLSYAHLDRRAIHATTNALDFCAVKDVISMGGSAAMSLIPGMLTSPRMSKVRPARPPSSGFARHLHLQRRCKCHDQRVVTLSHDGLREHALDGLPNLHAARLVCGGWHRHKALIQAWCSWLGFSPSGRCHIVAISLMLSTQM
jgi:hypothetical protein